MFGQKSRNTFMLLLPTEKNYNEHLLLQQIAECNESAFKSLFDQYKGRLFPGIPVGIALFPRPRLGRGRDGRGKHLILHLGGSALFSH